MRQVSAARPLLALHRLRRPTVRRCRRVIEADRAESGETSHPPGRRGTRGSTPPVTRTAQARKRSGDAMGRSRPPAGLTQAGGAAGRTRSDAAPVFQADASAARSRAAVMPLARDRAAWDRAESPSVIVFVCGPCRPFIVRSAEPRHAPTAPEAPAPAAGTVRRHATSQSAH